MSEDRDDVTRLLGQIACEQEVIEQLAAGTLRLQAIQLAKRMADQVRFRCPASRSAIERSSA